MAIEDHLELIHVEEFSDVDQQGIWVPFDLWNLMQNLIGFISYARYHVLSPQLLVLTTGRISVMMLGGSLLLTDVHYL